MTVTVDKKVIHIGWETAFAILVFTVTVTWGASTFILSLKSDLKDIKTSVATLARRDSIYFSKVDNNRKDIDRLTLGHDSLKRDMQVIEDKLSIRYHNVTERRENGALIFKSMD